MPIVWQMQLHLAIKVIYFSNTMTSTQPCLNDT